MNQNQKRFNPDNPDEIIYEMTDEIRRGYCDEAIKHNPDDGDAYFYRGKAFKEMKKWDEAVANFKTALSKNQGNNEYRQELQMQNLKKRKQIERIIMEYWVYHNMLRREN